MLSFVNTTSWRRPAGSGDSRHHQLLQPLRPTQALGYWQTAAADGTQFALYEENPSPNTTSGMAGGIAYHHISDTYIALFTLSPVGLGSGLHH